MHSYLPCTRHDGLDLERDWLKATRDRNLSGRPNPFPGRNPFEPSRPAGRVCPYKKGPKRYIRKPHGREGHWHSQYRWTDPNPVIEIEHQGSETFAEQGVNPIEKLEEDDGLVDITKYCKPVPRRGRDTP